MPAGISGTARYLVRYWLFYSFDDWRSRGERLWQAHEGDWENIAVALDADANPIFAAYSQHCSGTVRAWSNAGGSARLPVVLAQKAAVAANALPMLATDADAVYGDLEEFDAHHPMTPSR
jgi:hypothetical protein